MRSTRGIGCIRLGTRPCSACGVVARIETDSSRAQSCGSSASPRGAPGVLASAHLLAASNSPDGLLEYGVNHNPVRDCLLDRAPEGGMLDLGERPGLGLDVDRRRLAPYRIPV